MLFLLIRVSDSEEAIPFIDTIPCAAAMSPLIREIGTSLGASAAVPLLVSRAYLWLRCFRAG